MRCHLACIKEAPCFDKRIVQICKTRACVNPLLCKTCVARQSVLCATFGWSETNIAVGHNDAYRKTATAIRLFEQTLKCEISRFVTSMLLQEDTIPMA